RQMATGVDSPNHPFVGAGRKPRNKNPQKKPRLAAGRKNPRRIAKRQGSSALASGFGEPHPHQKLRGERIRGYAYSRKPTGMQFSSSLPVEWLGSDDDWILRPCLKFRRIISTGGALWTWR